MNQRMSRKELKTPDTFFQVSVRLFQSFFAHKREITIGLAAIVFLFIIYTIYQEYRQKLENKASYSLAIAEQVINDEGGALTAKGENALEKVIDEYDGTFSGFSAKIRLADLYFKAKKYEKAYATYEKIKEQRRTPLSQALASINMAYIREIQKDYTGALEHYKKLTGKEHTVYSIQAYFGMARCYEKLKDKAMAKDIYNKIISMYPTTEHAKTAKQYIAELETKVQ